MMDSEQRHQLWRFVRGDADTHEFEQWLYHHGGLENALGEALYLDLVSCHFSDKAEVARLRKALQSKLHIDEKCECHGIPDLASIPMGGEEYVEGVFYFEKVFESLGEILSYGPEKWWLTLYTCNQCQQVWMVAQEERIYDEFLLKRIDRTEAQKAAQGEWPSTFWTYEKTLTTARKFREAPQFFDPMAYSLQWTVEDLLKERPEITESEIANLLGLSASDCSKLVQKVRRSGADSLL